MRFNTLPLLILLLALQQAPAQAPGVIFEKVALDSLAAWFPSPEMKQLTRKGNKFQFQPYKLVGTDSLLAILRSALHVDTADMADSPVRIGLPLAYDGGVAEFRLACYTEGPHSSLDSVATVEDIHCRGVKVGQDYYFDFLHLSFEGGYLRASRGVPLSIGWYPKLMIRPISEALKTPHTGLEPYYMAHNIRSCGIPELIEYFDKVRENKQ